MQLGQLKVSSLSQPRAEPDLLLLFEVVCVWVVGWERWDWRQPVPPANVACYTFILPCLVQEEPGSAVPQSFPGAVNVMRGLLSSLLHLLPSSELLDWGSPEAPGEQNAEHPTELRRHQVHDNYGKMQLRCRPASASRAPHFTVKGTAQAVSLKLFFSVYLNFQFYDYLPVPKASQMEGMMLVNTVCCDGLTQLKAH